MKVKVFIDGSSGTTGLRIADRLAQRPEIELLSISAEGRKDVNERAKVINSADLAFLCLPDAASKEVMPLLRPDVKVLDTSTAFRTDAAWDYGFPELKGQKAKIQNSYRVAVPGCYASGFISIARPLVELGLVPQSYPFSCTGISGYSGGGKKMKNKPLPIVAIPTTAGTGTELDAWTVVTNEETKEKMSGGNKNTFPVLSIVDPDFMLSVPPKFTAYQGFDALFHSTESYINNTNNLMRDMLALRAIEAVGRNLATACQDGKNVQAREQVAFGSSLSGMVMSVDNLCSEHAMEHPLSAYYHEIAHGAGLIMLSRAYYTHFVEHCPELHDRFIDMAKAMGKTDAKEPMDFVTALVDLQKACGVDELKMSDYGITPEEFPKFVDNARSTMGILFKLDRLKLTDEDLVKIYTESYR